MIIVTTPNEEESYRLLKNNNNRNPQRAAEQSRKKGKSIKTEKIKCLCHFAACGSSVLVGQCPSSEPAPFAHKCPSQSDHSEDYSDTGWRDR